ncbi:response regulator [Bordetella muralis]|jgi:DNA-binding NarL/FixJ family response regulator|uniref:response regulator n=1 Tax=Bordetella muralis TaxID=1649130 RepID=UPI0039EEAB89
MPHTSKTIRLLLIDDHPLVRDGLRLRLETVPGLKVIGEAGHALAALAFLQDCLAQDPTGDTLPHLVLMDLNMPGMGGLSLIAQLHEQYPQIAVLVLTMHDNGEYIVQAAKAGARGYLLKHEPAQEIITAIHAVMSGRMYFSAAATVSLSTTSSPALLLTQRERDVLRHIADGHANKQIAQALNLSVRTVETHRLNIKRKLNIEGQAELIKYAVEASKSLKALP